MSHIDYWLTDIHSGRLLHPVDFGNVSWSMTVNDSALSTTHDKKVGLDDVQDIDVPWTAIPGETQRDRFVNVEPNMKAIAAFYVDDDDERDGKLGRPFIWGGITDKVSHWDDVSLKVNSVYSMFGERMLVQEGAFTYPRSKNVLSYARMSLRGIACEVQKVGMNKPGGVWPVDLPYLGEQHIRVGSEDNLKHNRNYWAWNVANLSVQQVLDKLAGVAEGPDMQWRPYLTSDGQYVRSMFVAGSDEERYLQQKGLPYTFNCFRGGGNLENIEVSYAQPYERVYATGAGEDAETLTYLAEDLTLVNREHPYSLREMVMSDTNASSDDVLIGEARGKLEANKWPIMQMTGEFDMTQRNTPQLGLFWPGEVCELDLNDWPDLPDGQYMMRVMEMSGDSASRVKLKFDVMRVPWF